MKDKKGFTLVELLAVIAILALLVIIALPKIVSLFTSAKEDAFVTETQMIYKTAEEQWLQDSLSQSNAFVYSSDNNKLPLTSSDAEYYVRFDSSGNVLHMIVTNGSYVLEAGSETNTEPISIKDLGASDSNSKYKATEKVAEVLFPDSIASNVFVLGDVNRDGTVNNADLELLDSHLKGNVTLNGNKLLAADINSDGVVNNSDYLELNNYLNGGSSVINNKASYKVEHFKQIRNDDCNNSTEEKCYNLDITDNMEAVSGASVSPNTKTYAGFTSPSKKTVTVASDGSTVVKYFYKRNRYTLTVTGPSCISFSSSSFADPIPNPDGSYSGFGGFNSGNSCPMGGGYTSYTQTFSAFYDQSITISSTDNVNFYQNGQLLGNKSFTVVTPAENTNYTFEYVNNASYTVKHYKQKINDECVGSMEDRCFDLAETENFSAPPKTSVSPNTKTYTGFTSPAKQTASVTPNGSLVIKYYYRRKKYNFTLNGNTCIDLNINLTTDDLPNPDGTYSFSDMGYANTCAMGGTGSFTKTISVFYDQEVRVSTPDNAKFYKDGTLVGNKSFKLNHMPANDVTYTFVAN